MSKLIIIFCITLSFICVACSSSKKLISHGELLDLKESCIEYNDAQCIKNVLIIKTKISSSYNNNATVKQNYINVYDYIKNNLKEDSGFDEIQYWAVAETTSSEEIKVVSFTVNKITIDNILNGKIESATLISDYLEDLYIHPSLN